MVNLQYFLGSVLVPSVISVIVTFVMMRLVVTKSVIPLLEEKFKDADLAVKKGLSAMGQKSGDVRAAKSMEKKISRDIWDNLPEIKGILGMLSQDTLDQIEENPEVAIQLIERYKPLIDKLFGSQQTAQQYDL